MATTFSTSLGCEAVQLSCASVLQVTFANCNLGTAFLDTTAINVEYDIRYRVFHANIYVALFNLGCRVDYTTDYVEDCYGNHRIDRIAQAFGARLEDALIEYIRDPAAFRERATVDPVEAVEAIGIDGEIVDIPKIRMIRL